MSETFIRCILPWASQPLSIVNIDIAITMHLGESLSDGLPRATFSSTVVPRRSGVPLRRRDSVVRTADNGPLLFAGSLRHDLMGNQDDPCRSGILSARRGYRLGMGLARGSATRSQRSLPGRGMQKETDSQAMLDDTCAMNSRMQIGFGKITRRGGDTAA